MPARTQRRPHHAREVILSCREQEVKAGAMLRHASVVSRAALEQDVKGALGSDVFVCQTQSDKLGRLKVGRGPGGAASEM